ncbi:uncharacterized protein EURHEDRAFT_132840 [Aspergillus ruber CBS 135680]|uniref:Uncharacterized protein n=1 Tax=Aspergillus ruber (strain CBS 135680) TaxID=1388766 RepID=A0A017SQZ1_ASPRC|nr:uncharacterized protein EURHEDRAFT_132840 [Aspergillus ruber CBS 135680]EYE99231.1 hypothetical protein EURHEDRAFT_132840 [Aspergillus ruber CBS 135680]
MPSHCPLLFFSFFFSFFIFPAVLKFDLQLDLLCWYSVYEFIVYSFYSVLHTVRMNRQNKQGDRRLLERRHDRLRYDSLRPRILLGVT